MAALSLVSAPAAEPVSLTEAKLQVQQGSTVDDTLLQTFIVPAARDRAEAATRRALITQTWDLLLERFPDEPYIEIPKPPLVSVTHVKYLDQNGTLQTLAAGTDYVVQAPAGPRCRRGRVALPWLKTWPTSREQPGAVTVRFVCGYGAAGSSVPPLLRAGMLLDIGTLYADRENVVRGVSVAPLPGGCEDIYRAFRSLPTTRQGGVL